MSRNPRLRAPLGLSSLSQEIIVDQAQSVNITTPARPPARYQYHSPSPSHKYKWSSPQTSLSENQDKESHVPLLPLGASTSSQGTILPQSTSLHDARANGDPFTSPSWRMGRPRRRTGTEMGTGSETGQFALSFDLDDTSPSGYDAQKRLYSYPKSDTAQRSIDAPSSTASSLFLKATPPGTPDRDSHFSTLKPPEEHPFAKSFEVPQWRKLAMHVALCGLAYPFLMIFVVVARNKSLFWSRLITGAGCGLLGIMLGISLLKLARRILEAATWATVIHASRVPEGPGVRLKDLAAESDDHASALTALRLIWDRYTYPGADRDSRKFYDSRPWSLWILFFLLNVLVAGVLPFILARIVDIDIHIVHQYQAYHEVAIKGDLSEADIQRADDLLSAFENYALTWTIAPFSQHGGLPPVVSFPWNNDTIYFSEIILSQLLPNGSGFGTFGTETTVPSFDLDAQHLVQAGSSVWLERGPILKFPRWGIRIRCAKVPDAPVNILPLSENNYTYLFTPRDTIRPLFDAFELPFPEMFEKQFNVWSTVHPNDTLPAALDISQVAMGAMFWDNGVAHSMKSTPLTLGQHGNGFVTMENLLVRLNTTYAPHGVFGTRSSISVPDKDGLPTYIGYDAAVCLQLYEPWVLEVYNSSVGVPTSMRIVDKAASIKDLDMEFWKEVREGKEIDDPNVSRALNSTNLRAVYIAGHQNSVNQILKDNGRDSNYVPSPTLISFTSGQGPFEYTELSEVYYAKARALADASNVLPYFAGSGLSVARQYPDRELTSAIIKNVWHMVLIIVFVFLMGLVSALFVPRLPLDIPRRGFDLYSWMTAFEAHELVAERSSGLGKSMELKDIMQHAGDLKFRYVG